MRFSLLNMFVFVLFACGVELAAAEQVSEIKTQKHPCINEKPLTCLALGNRYRDGNRVEQSYKTAASYYRFICERKYREGCDNLAELYYAGKGVAQDYEFAFHEFKTSCDKGHMSSCSRLGDLYDLGHGTKKSAEQALHYNNLACDKGYAEGCLKLGSSFYEGKVVERDFDQAYLHFKIACDDENAEGCFNLGMIHLEGKEVWETNTDALWKSKTDAIKYFEKSCKNGYKPACVELAYIREKPALGVVSLEIDVAKIPKIDYRAKAWELESACERGDYQACAEFGAQILHGLGTDKKPKKAYQLFDRACERKNARGCNGLGVAYYTGSGAAINYEKATSLLEQACKMGEMRGCKNLGDLYRLGKGVGIDYTKSRDLYKLTCSNGYGYGCSLVAALYRHGSGGTRPQTKIALKYMNKAIELFSQDCTEGDVISCHLLATYHVKGLNLSGSRSVALTLLKFSCDRGYHESCYEAGELYSEFLNYAKARDNYTFACHRKVGKSCFELAQMFEEGKAVQQDKLRAKELFKEACDKGHNPGCYRYNNFPSD